MDSAEKPGNPFFTCVVIRDPRYREPLLTNVVLTGEQCRALHPDRWPVEQVPLAAKQMRGAQRQFVFGPESRQRLPELALVSGVILMYAAATQPTIGRLRRVLSGTTIAELGPLPAQLRKKTSVTAHLPNGVLGHRRRKRPTVMEDEARLAA